MPALPVELIAVIILSIALAILLRAYDRLLREFKKIQNQRNEIEQAARQQAWKIVEEARNTAISMLGQVKINAGNQSELLDSKLDEVTQKQLSDYKQSIRNISKDIEEGALREMREMAEKEINEYREAKMKEINSKLFALIKNDILPNLVGKGIRLEDHQELINSALEEAKVKHVI